MPTVDMNLVRALAKEMSDVTNTAKGRARVQEFIQQQYPQFKTRHVLMIVNHNELRNG
jgi:hypothetical protein